MSAPWLSVIVPTYNGAAYLPAALESVVSQRDPNIEVIAVDDGSTDETPAILKSFTSRLRLRVINRRIGNWVANTNLGLEQTAGEWACFLHQDDVWQIGRLKAVRKAVGWVEGAERPKAHQFGSIGGPSVAPLPRPTLLLTAANFITATGRNVGTWRCPLAPGPAGNAPAHVASRLLVQNFVPLPGAVFRRDDALHVGGLDPDLWYTADWDFWLKLVARGSTRYLPQPLVAFRLHPESQTVKRSGGIEGFRRQHDIIWERHWPIWRDRFPNSERVEAAAKLSVETNVMLASLLHRGGSNWWKLIAAGWEAGIGGATHYVNSSRIGERVLARIRAGLFR